MIAKKKNHYFVWKAIHECFWLSIFTMIWFCCHILAEIQLKRQERKRRSTCISPQNALDIDPEVSYVS